MDIQLHTGGTAESPQGATTRIEQLTGRDSVGLKGRSSLDGSTDDRISVSRLAESIASTIQLNSTGQAGRVRQLSVLYAQGEYAVDSASVSRSIVSGAISGPGAGKV